MEKIVQWEQKNPASNGREMIDGVPIGISDGLPKNRRFWRGRSHVSRCLDLENAPGVVEMLRVPLRRRPVRPFNALGRLWFSVDVPHSLNIPPFCHVFPEGRTPISLPSRQSVS